MQVHTVYHKESELGTKTGKELHFDIGVGVYKFEESQMVKNIDGYGKFSFYQFKVENLQVTVSEIGSKSCLDVDPKFFKDKGIDISFYRPFYEHMACPDSNDVEFSGSI